MSVKGHAEVEVLDHLSREGKAPMTAGVTELLWNFFTSAVGLSLRATIDEIDAIRARLTSRLVPGMFESPIWGPGRRKPDDYAPAVPMITRNRNASVHMCCSSNGGGPLRCITPGSGAAIRSVCAI
jgi:hypothetical protein